MKTHILLLLCIVIGLQLSCNYSSQSGFNPATSVNAVLGDISFIDKFGISPDKSVDYNTRIKTHLEYVEQKLRAQKPVLSAEQLKNRERMLDLLHEYWTMGKFPRNYDYKENRPCFIDKNGNICAVGYLVEQTAGREVAEQINARYKYEYLLNIHDEALDNWIAGSGLTKEECTMIQPQYSWQQQNQPPITVAKEYAIGSTLLAGANVSLSTMNVILSADKRKSPLTSVLGIISGSSSIFLGVYNYDRNLYKTHPVGDQQRNLSMMNIGLGTASVFFGVWNLTVKKKTNEPANPVSYNFYPVSMPDNRQGLGFTVIKRF